MARSVIESSKKALGIMTGVSLAKGLLSGKNSRIGNGAAIALILLAVIADLLTLIPLVGDFVAPIFWFGIAIYLWSIGCGWTNPEYLVTEVADMIVEMVPGLQELPFIVLGMIIIIILVRIEDRTGVPVMKMVGGGVPKNVGGVRAPQLKPPPLNSDGVRLPQRPISASITPNGNKKLHPLQEAEYQKWKANPNRDFAAEAYGKTLKEKYKEYRERGFDDESSQKSALVDAEAAANFERNKRWSEFQQRYV